MKKIIIAVAAVTLAFASCTDPVQNGNGVEIRFSTNISEKEMLGTRVSNDRWEAGDRIGLYMMPAGKDVSVSFSGTRNVLMNFSSDSRLVPNRKIYYPESGNVDFIAYYPYDPDGAIPGYKIPIGIEADQSQGLPSEILFSNNAKNIGESLDDVSLNFRYSLVKLVVNVSATDASELIEEHFADMSLVIDKLYTQAELSLVNGGINSDTYSAMPITMYKSATTATSCTFEALLLPTATASTATFDFTILGKTFSKPLTERYDMGTQIELDVELDVPSPDWWDVIMADAKITPRRVSSKNYSLKGLTVPTDLVASEPYLDVESGLTAVDFSWNSVEDAEYYEFALHSVENGEYTLIGEMGTRLNTTKITGGFLASNTYGWAITPVRAHEKGARAKGPEISVPDLPKTPPAGLRETDLFSSQVTLSWEPVLGVMGYLLELDGEEFAVSTTRLTRYELLPSTAHQWRVRAATRKGENLIYTDWSELRSFTTPATVPWDYSALLGAYSAEGESGYAFSPGGPATWTGEVRQPWVDDEDYYAFSTVFGTNYSMYVRVLDGRLFLEDRQASGTAFPNTVYRVAGIYVDDDGARYVPMTGIEVELTWDEQARTLTFPSAYNGNQLLVGVSAFFFSNGQIQEAIGVSSDYYADLVLTVGGNGEVSGMSGRRVDIAPARFRQPLPATDFDKAPTFTIANDVPMQIR